MPQLTTGTFDASQHEKLGSFDPIPAGKYPMMITDSDILDTKAKTGKYIKFEFVVIAGEYKGRKIWANLNIINPNPVAVEIANKELATICEACGKAVIANTEELHGIPFLGRVKIRPAKDDWPPSNDMVSYEALSAADMQKAMVAAASIETSSPAATSAAPSGSGGGAPPAWATEEVPTDTDIEQAVDNAPSQPTSDIPWD